MIQRYSGLLSIRTHGRGLTDVTRQINSWAEEKNVMEGVLTIFIQHSSASLTIQENADPDVQLDLMDFYSKLVPDDSTLYRHISEGADDMPSHIRASLTDVSLTIPITEGRMCLGTWQGIYVFEHRTSPHQRRLALNFMGE